MKRAYLSEKLQKILAILFACGEPLELRRISEAVGLPSQDLSGELLELNAFCRSARLPFEIVLLSDSAQLCSLPEFAPAIRQALSIKRNSPLSQAALEVLAVIAYNQPVTKAFVEQVRGVDCSGVLSALCEKGLVEETGRLELPGRPIAYGTTANFLRSFSLLSLEQLPCIDAPLPKEDPENEETSPKEENG